MSRGTRVTRLYREAGVPTWIVVITLWFWLVVGVSVALHFNSYDVPALEANLAGLASGGFVAAIFYFLTACE